MMMVMVIIIDGYDYGYYDDYFNEITWWIWSIKLSGLFICGLYGKLLFVQMV